MEPEPESHVEERSKSSTQAAEQSAAGRETLTIKVPNKGPRDRQTKGERKK